MFRRIAQIILPKADNEGNSLMNIHAEYRKAFCVVFGGYTALPACGGWVSDSKLYEDASVLYQIAMHDTAENIALFRELANAALLEMRQEAIFIVLPSGEVEFITKEG